MPTTRCSKKRRTRCANPIRLRNGHPVKIRHLHLSEKSRTHTKRCVGQIFWRPMTYFWRFFVAILSRKMRAQYLKHMFLRRNAPAKWWDLPTVNSFWRVPHFQRFWESVAHTTFHVTFLSLILNTKLRSCSVTLKRISNRFCNISETHLCIKTFLVSASRESFAHCSSAIS